MKKIVSLIVVLIAFGINANAQTKTLSAQTDNTKEENIKESAMKDISDLTSIIKIDESLKNDFMSLIIMRSEAVAQVESNEDKKAIFEKYTMKMLSALSPEQLERLKSKEELYNRLAVFTPKK